MSILYLSNLLLCFKFKPKLLQYPQKHKET